MWVERTVAISDAVNIKSIMFKDVLVPYIVVLKERVKCIHMQLVEKGVNKCLRRWTQSWFQFIKNKDYLSIGW